MSRLIRLTTQIQLLLLSCPSSYWQPTYSQHPDTEMQTHRPIFFKIRTFAGTRSFRLNLDLDSNPDFAAIYLPIPLPPWT